MKISFSSPLAPSILAVSIGRSKKVWRVLGVIEAKTMCENTKDIILRIELVGERSRYLQNRTTRVCWINISAVADSEILDQGKVRLRWEGGLSLVIQFAKQGQELSFAV
jgi:hypothetical protein